MDTHEQRREPTGPRNSGAKKSWIWPLLTRKSMNTASNDNIEERKLEGDMEAKTAKGVTQNGSRREPRSHWEIGSLMKRENVEGPFEERRKSVSAVEANAASVAMFVQAKVRVADMPGFMQVHAFRCARRTYDSLEKFSPKHMAYNIKKEFDKAYGPAWHCIVGRSFGSFVTHSTGCFLYFSMDKVFILVFKTRVERANEPS